MAELAATEEIRADYWKAYAKAAQEAGCSEDQFRNFARAGIVLSPRQLSFAAACREADEEGGPIQIGFGGARGGGKTLGLLAQIGLDDCKRREGLKCLLLRKAVRANLENFQDNRLKLFSRVPHKFAPSRGVLTFANGSRIVAGHFQREGDIDNYLGLEYDVIGVEEATTLSARKFKDIETCCRTSKKDWGPRVYSTTNPGGISHAHYKAKFILPWRAGTQSDTRFVQALPTDNPWNNPEYIRVLDNLSGWQKRAWRFGDWDIASGQYFVNFRLERHVEPMREFDERRIKEWFAGFDYGFTHYTVFLLGGADGDGNIYVLDEHSARGRLPGAHAELIHAMISRHKTYVDDSEGRTLTMRDIERVSAGPDVFSKQSNGMSIADDYAEHGIRLEVGYVNRINGWAEILKRLGDEGSPARLLIHPRCVRLCETLPALAHDADNPEDVLKVDVDEDGLGGDDAPDALRMMVATKTQRITVRRLSGL